MKTNTLILLVAALLPFMAFADDSVCWDFSKPETFKECPFILRGESKIANGALQALDASGKPCGAVMEKIHPLAAPDKAFRLTVVFSLDAQFERKLPGMLWDSKYVASPNETPQQQTYHRGFQLFLVHNNGINYRIQAAFGFGTTSQVVQGNQVSIPPNEKHTLSMEFNASDRVSFTFNGAPAGVCILHKGYLAAPYRNPVLGDRQASNYWPLGGSIYSVTMEKLPWRPIQVAKSPVARRVFVWNEKDAVLKLAINNFTDTPCTNLTLLADMGENGKKEIAVASVATDQATIVPLPVNTHLLPGEYDVNLTLKDDQGNLLASNKETFTVTPDLGDYMTVMLWGGLPVETCSRIGFTHTGMSLVPHEGSLNASAYGAYIDLMDSYFKHGISTYCPVTLDRRFTSKKRFLRVGPNNSSWEPPSVDPSREELQQEILKHVELSAINLGGHPAWNMALSISEERDRTNVDFSGRMNQAFREFSGYDMPSTITGKYPIPRRANLISLDRIIADDDPELTFYRWFWTCGDGWNDLHTKIAAKFHEHIKRDFITFHDPAVRVPLVWGSGGKVDAIAHWTYTNPDPIKIAQTTDELLAMADGCEGQKVLSMTQIIWYRSAAAPGTNVENKPEWVIRNPDAIYMTLPPDALRIAFWTKISRQLAGIQYHGANSLVGGENTNRYCYTNSESQEALRDVVHTVVKPLGPVLKKAAEQPVEVAILETFSSTIYAQENFPIGWSRGWVADLHLALQWAHFQPAVLFDDHILTGKKLDHLKVLFIPGAEIMTRNVVNKIKELQAKGVIIVGDEFTPPELSVDLRIMSVPRNDLDPQKSKADLQQLGRQIADALASQYQSRFKSSNQDVVLRTRQAGTGEYLFMVNDKRTFGDYIGQWKRVMEKGLPNAAQIAVKTDAKAIYDAIEHKAVAFKRNGEFAEFAAEFPPAGGKMLVMLPAAIAAVNVEVSTAEVARGGEYEIAATVCDADNKVIDALLPVEVTITDVQGKRLPGSGFYAMQNGRLIIREHAASNMTTGKVRIKVFCQSSGKSGSAEFVVR